MNSEDIEAVIVVIVVMLIFIPVLGVIGGIIFTAVKGNAYDNGWIDGYVTAKKEDRRHSCLSERRTGK